MDFEKPLRRDLIKKEFEELEIISGADDVIPLIVKMLCMHRISMINPLPKRPSAQISRSAADNKLKKIKSLAEKLQHELNSLNHQCVRVIEDSIPKWGEHTDNFLFKLEFAIENIVENIENCDLSKLPEKALGRKPEVRPIHIASIVACGFFVLTGNRPTVTVNVETNKAGGNFYDLCANVFSIMDLDNKPEHYVKLIVADCYQYFSTMNNEELENERLFLLESIRNEQTPYVFGAFPD